MTRWSMSCMSRTAAGLLAATLAAGPCAWAAVTAERDPMTLKVVAINPSSEKSKTVPVRIDLPQEVRPNDIVDAGELKVEFDTERSIYYVYKPDVALAPKQTRVFEVVVRDVWFIPDVQLTGLKTQATVLMKRLEKSEYAESAKQLGDAILARLDEIAAFQIDEAVGRKQRIGGYRRNLQMLTAIKEDIERMEKLLSFVGGPPVPAMLEKTPLKSDAPSTTTTWLVIFLIVIFMGLLAGQFFFTWQRRVKTSGELTAERDAAFPAPEGSQGAPVSNDRNP